MNALEKAITHIDDLKLSVDLNVHKIVSPDNLDVYMDLCNLIGVIKGDVLESLKEQEQKCGRWEPLTGMAPPEYHGHKICSICECFAPYDPLHVGREKLSPYCPGCGAKMEVTLDA